MPEELNLNDPKLKLILDRTLDLFYEFGIRNLNMDDISHKLRISKKTLYQSVKNKEDLIEKLFTYEENRWNDKLDKIIKQELNAIDVLIQVSLLVYDEMGRLNPKLKFELKKYYEPVFNRLMERKQNHILEHISNNMQKGIGEGLYREDVNIDLVSGLYVRNLVEMHNKDYAFGENITFDQVFEVLFENHISAISSPEGIEYFEKRKSEITHLNKKD